MNRLFAALGSLTVVAVLTGTALATKITFESAASGNNVDIPTNYGSYIAANGTGFVTTDGSGATPSIGLTWLGDHADEWEYHTANSWTHETPVHVAQIDLNRFNPPVDNVAEIAFAPIDGRSVKINSFLLSGATDQDATATFDWEVVGTGTSGTLNVGVGMNTGTVPVNFTGASGVGYTLRFTRTSDADTGFGTALDDLSFSEVLLPDADVLRLFVDRATGGISLKNVGTGSVNIKGYSITSDVGALNYGNWKAIAGNYDVNGNTSVDTNDDWTKLSAPTSTADLSEFEFGGDGGTLAPNASIVLNVPAGNVWLKNPTEDLELEVVLGDGRINRYSAEFINGPASGFAVGDLNFDGSINALDWPIYNAGRGDDLSSMSLAQAYQEGDLDGDRDNDIADFVQFKSFFTIANGAGSFASLISVPEASSFALLSIGLVSFLRSRRKIAAQFLTRPMPRRCLVLSRFAVILGSLVMLVIVAGTTQATTLNFAKNSSGATPVDNGDLNVSYGSNVTAANIIGATAGAEGFTPNIALAWAPTGGPENVLDPNGDVLEFHSAGTFTGAGLTVPVLQLDVDISNHSELPAHPTLDFVPEPGWAVQIFDFQYGNATDQESQAPHPWTFSILELPGLTPTGTSFTTAALGAGDNGIATFNFNGDPGVSYRLLFDDGSLDCTSFDCHNPRTGIDNVRFGQVAGVAPQLKLVVNTLTGVVTLANDSGSGFDIDSYEILSPSSSLDPAGWSSLQQQDFEGNGAPGTGNGWEVAGGVGADQLIESYLLGSSVFSDGASVSLGQAFDHDKIGVQQDLQFLYHEVGTGGFLRTGLVEYVQIAVDGDYNQNGIVDAADYTVWRNTLGSTTDHRADGDGNGTVQQADYTYWKSRFGNTSGSGSGSSAAAVPEPGTLGLLGLLAIALVLGSRCCDKRAQGTSSGSLSWILALAVILTVAQSALAAKTDDRRYEFGDGGTSNTQDSQFISADDKQDLSVPTGSGSPTFVDVSSTGLSRPGAATGDKGAQFGGTNDVLSGVPLNRPDETAGPDFIGLGPLLFPFPFNYDSITARGLQMWVYPDAAAIGTHRQGIVFDTIAAGGVSITADGKWTQTNDSRVVDGNIAATVPVIGNQWYHVMQHIYPTSQPGAPTIVAGTGAGDGGFTSVVYVNGVAVSANNGNPSPGELDDGNRIGVLAVGAEEVASLDTVNPEFTNYFKGTVDDLKMYVFGDNSSDPLSPPGQDYGTFNLFSDNDWIASQIALIPSGILKPGDVNRDGSVNQSDVTAFASGWKKEKRLKGSLNTIMVGDWETWGWGDLNLDGVVDLHDALILDQQLSPGSGSGLDLAAVIRGSVPEPATLMLVCVGFLAMAFRRRR